MNLQSALAVARSEIVSLVKSIARLLMWGVVMFVGLITVFVFLRPAGHILGVQTSITLVLMVISLLPVRSLAKSRAPDRNTWISVHLGIAVLSIAAISWVPAWSAYIVGIIFVLFISTPNVLAGLASRRAHAGYAQAAAFHGRLFSIFHPSKHARFYSCLLAARAFGSIEQKLAAYRVLASHATAEQSAFLNYWSSVDQDDWEGVLGLLRGADNRANLEALEIRALGELGHIDEMIAAYAAAESSLPAGNLLMCRLYVLAFSGRTDAVRAVLSRQLRFVRPRNKAYWIFVAGRVAGTPDTDARRVLASDVATADDETFRRAAQRHLAAGRIPGGASLSASSHATISTIEKALAKNKRHCHGGSRNHLCF